MTPGRYVLLALAVAAAGVGWWVLRRTATAPLSAPAAVSRLTWRPGAAQRYTLTVVANVRLGGDAAAHGDAILQELRAELAFRTLAVGDEAVSVGVRLDPVELRVGGVSDPAVTRALATPFRVSFARDGRVLGCEFPAGVAAHHTAMLEEIVRTFQVTVRSADAWTCEEDHATGRYVAEYSRDGSGSLRRTKPRYVPVAAGTQPVVEVRSAEADVRFDDGSDWLTGMQVEEQLAARDPSGMTFAVHTRASLALQPAAPVVAAEGGEAWAFTPAVGASAAIGSIVRNDLPIGELAEQVQTLLTGLDQAQDARVVWIHRLRDLVRADDRVAALLLAALQAGEWLDRTRADVFLACELGATPSAQAGLAQVGGDAAWPHRDRLRALIALGGMPALGEASRASLWALARDRASAAGCDLANTALLALGASAASLAGTDAPAFATVRNGLLAEAWGAQDPGQRATVLLALANSGDATLASELVPFLDDTTPAVRRAAVQAVVRLGGHDLDQMAARLPAEPNSGVRAAIAEGLAKGGVLSPAGTAIVRDAVLGEVDERTRLELVRCLGRHVAEAENVDVLRRLLASERSDRVRRQIGEILGPIDAVMSRQ